MRTFVGHRNRNARKQFRLTKMRLIFGRTETVTPLVHSCFVSNSVKKSCCSNLDSSSLAFFIPFLYRFNHYIFPSLKTIIVCLFTASHWAHRYCMSIYSTQTAHHASKLKMRSSWQNSGRAGQAEWVSVGSGRLLHSERHRESHPHPRAALQE